MRRLASILCLLGLSAGPLVAAEPKPTNADELLVVNCLLPGQLRQLGQRTTYVSSRRPLRTTALDCRVRGGEYVLRDRSNLKSALAVWLNTAEDGDAESQTTLGEIFEQGLGVPPDYDAARFWYEQAAAQGQSRALVNLGNLYERGLGVPADGNKALTLYRRAAGLPEQSPAALLIEDTPDVAPVGTMISREVGTLRDAIKALQQENTKLTAELGNSQAQLVAASAADAERAHDKDQNRALLLDHSRVIEGFKANLLERDAQIDTLTTELGGLREDLATTESMSAELVRLQADIRAQQTLIAQSRMELEQSTGAASTLREVADQQLDALAQRDAIAQAQIAEIQQLVAEIATLKAQVTPSPKTPPSQSTLMAGPTITIVDPTLPTTRGLVKVSIPAVSQSHQRTRQIVGRVTAPAGLLVVSINDVPVETNSAGVFAHMVTTSTRASDVLITAIDQLGKRADLSFQMVTEATDPPSIHAPDVELGSFHALLIGNSNYRHLPQLETPQNDVARLQQLLTDRYGFRVTVLMDASRYQILSALNEMRAHLTSEDNLLVYYAGHGELDRTNMRGHWLPVDAEPTNTANWVSNVDITDILNVIRARHIMLVVDSCYSGTLTRSSLAQLDTGTTDAERDTWLKLLSKNKARVVLTSGGLAPVLDIGGGRHSVFAKAFLEVLETNLELLTGRSLYQAVAARVAHAASAYEFEQLPAYAPIARAGHEAGDFLLLPTSM